MRRYLLGGLILLLILGLAGGLAFAQEEEASPPEEEAAYSPEEVAPVPEVAPAPEVVAPAKPTNAVQNIEIEDLPEKVRIIITTTQPAEYIIGKIYKPKMLYVDILNSVNDLPRKRLRVKKGPVERIRSSQYQVLPIEISRIVVDLEKWVKHEIAREENRLYLEFYKPEVLIAKVKAPPEEEAPPEEKKVPPEEEKVPLPEERLVRVDFIDAPMSVVLNFLAELSGYNIVASPEVTAGTVTINLKDVPVMTALDTILKTKDLWYTKEKNIIMVMTMAEFMESIKAKAELTKIYYLQYAIAEDLAKTLNEVLGGAVKRELPKGFKTTWVAAGAEQAVEALKTVEFTGKTFVIADKFTNSLIVTTDTPANFIMLEMIIKKLDIEVPQVLIQVMIAEVTLTDADRMGVDWAWYNIHTGENVGGSGASTRPHSEIKGVMRFDQATTGEQVSGSSVWFGNVPGAYKLGLYNRNVNTLIQAISSRNPVDILSSPRILTLNNQEAKVKVVREYPFILSETSTTTTYTYKDVGIILTVTPQINPDKFVRLNLKVESLRYAGLREGSNMPMFDKRETTGSMLVQDSQTLIMGGMIQESVTDTFTKVPVLGSIPGLGLLFRKKVHDRVRTELMVFTTPYVITSPGEGRKVTEKQEAALATPPPEDLRAPKEETPVGKDLKGTLKGEWWRRERRKERKEKPAKVEEKKIEIPELEETKIPEVEKKKE